MLAGPNQNGVFTVSLNPAAPSFSHPVASSAQSFPSAIILPQPVQQVAQSGIPQLVSGGQIVNLTPVRAAGSVVEQSINITANPTSHATSNKTHSCSFCHKIFSSRYNVTRHEKICKLNSSIPHQPTLTPEPRQCEHCQKTFMSPDLLNRHQKKCKRPKGISVADIGWSSRRVHLCKHCGKEFSTKWNVIRHEKIFHKPGDPVIVPQSIANGLATAITVVGPAGKPERQCRFCGNYFSSKYNTVRHEKICSRVRVNSQTENNLKPTEPQVQQQIQEATIQLQAQTPQQHSAPKALQITSNSSSSQTIPVIIPEPAQQTQQPQQAVQSQQQPNVQQQQPQTVQQPLQQNVQQQPLILHNVQQQNVQQQQRLQQQIVQQQLNHQVQQIPQLQATNIQTNQPQQIIPQQTMLLIEQPSTPFHVCKFCNKQFTTRCDPGSHNLFTNVPTVATITGQPMQIGSSGGQITGLVTPVMASLPQVTLVQPHFTTLQGQQFIQPTQQQTAQLQQEKGSISSAQTTQEQGSPQNDQPQQQITLPQQIRVPIQQIQSQPLQIQTVQHSGPSVVNVDRPHACKFCDKHFASKWYLDQHEKIHTGEADMCKVCGKFFVTRWHLDKHMRIHMESSPSKKAKKDSGAMVVPTIGEVIPADAILTNHVTTIDFPHVIIGAPGQSSTPASLALSRAPTFTVATSRPLVQQNIPQEMEQVQSQPTPSTSAPTSVTSSEAEEHSTIDKSQIASTLSISYS